MAGQRPRVEAEIVVVLTRDDETDGAGTGEVQGSGTGCILEKNKSGFLV